MSREAPPDAFAAQPSTAAARAAGPEDSEGPKEPLFGLIWLGAPMLGAAIALALTVGFRRLGDMPAPAGLALVVGALALTGLAALRRVGVAVPVFVDVLIGATPWLVSDVSFARAVAAAVDLLHYPFFSLGLMKANVAGAALRELAGGPCASAGLWFGAALPILASADGERRASGALVAVTALPLVAVALLFGPLTVAPVQVLLAISLVFVALFAAVGLRGAAAPAPAAAVVVLLSLAFVGVCEAAFCWFLAIPDLGAFASGDAQVYLRDLSDTVAPVRAHRWAPLVVAAPVLLAGAWWALREQRRIVRALVALAAAALVVGVTQNWSAVRHGSLTPSPWPPWQYAEGFTPAELHSSREAPNSGRTPLLLAPGGIVDLSGRRLVGLDDVAAISAFLTMRMGTRAEGPLVERDPAFGIVADLSPPRAEVPRLDMLIDARLPLPELHRFVAAVATAPICDINLVGPETPAPPSVEGSYGPYRGLRPRINTMAVRLRRRCPADPGVVELDPPLREPMMVEEDRPQYRAVTRLRPVALTGSVQDIITRSERVAHDELPLWVVPTPSAPEPSRAEPATVDGAP